MNFMKTAILVFFLFSSALISLDSNKSLSTVNCILGS